jgi:hypothetical protein
MISLTKALGRSIGFDQAVDLFTLGMEEYFGIHLKRRILADGENESISLIQKDKYGDPDWIFNRISKS